MEIDGRSVTTGSEIEAVVCIVGAGAAGITVARALGSRGVPVLLLESGGLGFDAAVQNLAAGSSSGHSYFPLEAARLRYFGGTTNHWVGWCRPLDPIDYEAKPWAPGTGWPLRPEDLAPYYKPASEICELTSLDYRPETWTRPDAPGPLPLDPTRIRTTVFQLSPPTRFGFRYRDELLRSDVMRVFFESTAVELLPDRDVRCVERVRVRTLAGNEFTVRARHVVVAAGGIDNARILLASRSVASAGLGNDHDLVGRTFMEHPHLVAGFFLPSDPGLDAGFYRVFSREGARANGALVLPAKRIRAERLLNASITLDEMPRMPPSYVESELSRAFESFRLLGRAAQRGEIPDEFATHVWNVISELDDVAAAGYARLRSPEEPGFMYKLFVRSEQAPNPDSRVTLSDEIDALGMPRPNLDWRLSEIDLRSIRRTQELLALEVGRAGIGRVFLPPDGDLPTWSDAIFGGYHHMGTTRMDPDPTRGVVDNDCRVHGSGNLWVAGSSVFPSVGYANPTLTIVALGLRLSDRLAKEVQG